MPAPPPPPGSSPAPAPPSSPSTSRASTSAAGPAARPAPPAASPRRSASPSARRTPITLDPTLKGRPRRTQAALGLADLLEDQRRAALDRHPSVPAALAATAAAIGPGRPCSSPTPPAAPSPSAASRSPPTPSPAPSPTSPPAQRVGILLPTAAGVPVVLLALWRLHVTPAMLNPTLGPGPMLSCLATARATRVISSRLLVREAKLQPQIDALTAAGMTLLWTEDLQRRVDTATKLRAALSAYTGRARRGAPLPGRAPIAKTDPAVILFTSGTEGAPKGVVLSHGNLLANVTQLLARTDIAPSDTMLASLPVFHSLGLTGGLLLPLITGARVVTYPNPLHYKAIPEIAQSTPSPR